MRPLAFLIVILLLIVALLYFLSTQAEEVPTRTIDTEVRQSGEAR